MPLQLGHGILITVMRGIALWLLTVGLNAAWAQTPGEDWALGEWHGSIVDAIGHELDYAKRVLIVARGTNGVLTCRWDFPEKIADAPVLSKCVIDAEGITLDTTANSTVSLSRSGSSLVGTMLFKDSTHHLVNLTRK